MRDIDQIIRDMSVRSSNPIGLVDASLFFVGMKKLAEGEMPDTTGAVEGPFTVPLPQAVELIAQMISNEFKTQVYYIYYANMLRGLSHHSIAEEFMDHAQHELEHATYLLRRMSVLSPGGISIPPYPPPEPLTDPNEIVQKMIVEEQMGLSLWKALLQIVGDNPMRHTIEQFLQREEEHQDELWQLVEAPMPSAAPSVEGVAPEKPEPEQTSVKVETTMPSGAKVASILDAAARRKQASAKDSLMASLALAVKNSNHGEATRLREQLQREHGVSFEKKSAIATFEQLRNATKHLREEADAKHKKEQRTEHPAAKKASLSELIRKTANFGAPIPPTMETPEGYVAHEKELAAQQAMAEAAHARTTAMQASQAAQQAQAEAQAAQEQLQQAQQQVEQLSAQVAQGSQQEMMATQQAAEAEARAADHSISKMQLGMRINQMRQELANFVMQDPVSETAATVSDLAAQGQPATPMQQAQAEQAAMAGQDPNAPQPSAEAQQQTQEAQNAQQHAQEQTQEAEQAQTKDQQKQQGTSVTVKTSNDMGTVVGRVGTGRGAVGQVAAPAAGGLSSLIQKARPYAPHIAAGLGGAALIGGGLALAHRKKQAGIVDGTTRAAGRGLVEGMGEAVVEGAKKHAPMVGLGALAAGGLAHAHRQKERGRRREDIAHGVAEGIRRSKTASPADRRMARAIFDGPNDTLGRSLIDIIKEHAPGTAAQAAAQKAVAEGVESAKNVDLGGLGQKLRPHLPAFGVGVGTGLLGSKMLSRRNDQQQDPAYYIQ